MTARDVTFRIVTHDDTEFLYAVYASTRAEELALVDWDEAAKAAFLRGQFNAQHQAYRTTYPEADFLIIQLNDRPVGRLYLARGEREIRIIDIALLPEHRNAGIGGAILRDVLAEGARDDKRVGIHVEMFNPAQQLYERLGFRQREIHGVYYFMEWTPGTSAGEGSIGVSASG
jgi:ribosomal protein S18 acetylase RimI-like enzyme